MEMCYDGALVMPSNFAVVDVDEMMYLEGGSTQLPMKTSYMNKKVCKSTAASLIKSKKVKRMSKQGIAEEIFAHAQIFYRAAVINLAGVKLGVIQEIARRAALIDIEDGGDKWYRRAAYTALWYGNPSIPV
ncbi:MAG: hypothetical protein HFJ04_04495 [Lachnospiraceae bacterium]|nr:hypothetical protein [Lachnospiraceae bacterium]